jgi:hypothetical protein
LSDTLYCHCHFVCWSSEFCHTFLSFPSQTIYIYNFTFKHST